MNGRVYDPQIGRFLSADPHIQDPYNTQSYNRYSYVMNNPLKYTDPSGYWWNPFKAAAKAWRSVWRGVKKYGRQIVAIVVAIYTGGATLAAGWSVWASGAAAGFAGGAISTGSLKGAIRGAVLGGVTASVANHIGYGKSSFAKWAQKDIYNKAIAHGLSQGAISQVSGGNFKEGFLGGAFSSYTGDAWLDTSSGGVFIDTMISSVSGGIAAELGGGKFANGARSAAFVSLYNHNGSAYEGDDYAIYQDDGLEHFHEPPLKSSTPLINIFGSIKFIGSAVKNTVTRILCVTVILCAPSNPISNTARDFLEDTHRLKNIYGRIRKDSNKKKIDNIMNKK